MIHNVIGFDWDQGNLEKCQKHGVNIAEIEVLFQQEIAVFPDISHSQGEDRFIGIGKSVTGRHVFLAFTLRTIDNDMLIRPISARYMHEKEVNHYENATTKTKNR